MTYEERCRVSEQCLPYAPFREMLTKLHDEMLKALAEQQAQPQQELVAWGVDWGHNGERSCVAIVKKHNDGTLEVVAVEYDPKTSPPQRTWVGLTDEEIEKLRKNFATLPAITAIEAKLKEKNT